MGKLTEKQQLYAVNRAAGVARYDAAIAAGYAAPTARVMATQLEARADIKAAIAAAKKGSKAKKALVDEVMDENPKNKMPKDKYTDPMVFLTDAMNHKHLPIAARADYAKALLPYVHARIAEKGKKESKADAAKAASKGKFGAKKPPTNVITLVPRHG